MFAWLSRPFPSFQEQKRTLRMSLLAGLIVTAILFLGSPFGMDMYPLGNRLILSASYGGATTLVSLVMLWLAPQWVPHWFDERRWTVGREIGYILLLLFCIALANMLVNNYWNATPFTLFNLVLMVGYTLLLGIIPVTVSVLVKQYVLVKKYAAEAGAINRVVEQKEWRVPQETVPTQEMSPVLVTLAGDNQGEVLTLHPDHWLAAEANDNYCKLYFLKGGQVNQVLFRTTLKKLEEQLAPAASCYRCHKSFLVNLNHVNHLSGNAQGYRLHMNAHGLEIPVSRSLNADLKARFAASQP